MKSKKLISNFSDGVFFYLVYGGSEGSTHCSLSLYTQTNHMTSKLKERFLYSTHFIILNEGIFFFKPSWAFLQKHSILFKPENL